MMNIAEWSIRRPLIIWSMALLLIGAGLSAYYTLPRFEDPEFTIKQAQIVTSYPGATPTEVAGEVSTIIEDAAQQLGQLKELESESTFGSSLVKVEIKDQYGKKELPQIWDELRNKIADAASNLPPGAGTPRVIDDYGDVYGIFFALTGKGAGRVRLHEFAKFLQIRLVNAADVSRITLFGVQPEALYITLQREKMGLLGIAPAEIFKILKERNLVTSEGWMRVGSEWLPVKMDAGTVTPEAIRRIVVRGNSDRLITLGDLATVTLTHREPPDRMIFFNGEPAVGIGISTVGGGNVVTTGMSVQQKLKGLADSFPVEMRLNVVSMQSDSVVKAVRGFVENLLEAIVIVIVILLIFMGVKSGLIIGFVLFLTICGTLAVMGFFQIALQRISLGALIIALGMLVDNAIVVTEGMMMRIRAGEDKVSAARAVVGQTMWPLLGATAIAITAFGAIGLSDDSSGEFCGSLFWVLLISLGMSWITAVTITPLLCVQAFHPEKTDGQPGSSVSPYDGVFFRGYRRILLGALRHRRLTVLFLLLALGAGIYGFGFVDRSFFPSSTRPQFIVDIRLPYGSDIRATNAAAAAVEKEVAKLPGVKDITRLVGGGALRFILTYSPEEPDTAFAQLLVDVEDWRKIDGLIGRIYRDSLKKFAGVDVIPYKFRLGPGATGAIQARFSGNDPAVLRRLADEAMRIMRLDPEARSIYCDWRNPIKVIRPVFSQYRSGRAGVTEGAASEAIRENFEGLRIGTYRDGEELIPIYARARAEVRNIENFDTLMVWSPVAGKMIPLGQLFDRIDVAWLDPVVVRRDRVPTVTIQCDPVTELASALFDRLRPRIEKIQLPPGYTLEWGGEYEDSAKASSGVFAKLPPFIIVMVVILLFMFNSVRQSLVIWLTVPLALIGVAVGLLLTGESFGFMALLGFLSLSGMMIKNGIILIDEINAGRKRSGEDVKSLVEAAVSRVRPVLLAALTTILGMAPLVPDAFFSGMACTIMFGLAFACVLTLVAIPVLYSLFYRTR